MIGICLHKILLPVLRSFVAQKMSTHYLSLKSSKNIDKQVYSARMEKDGSFYFNYGSINNNLNKFRRDFCRYDYKVKTAEDLGKLYLEPKMAKYKGKFKCDRVSSCKSK